MMQGNAIHFIGSRLPGIIASLVLVFMLSCIPQQKTVYLQDANRAHGKAYPMAAEKPYQIKPGDNLFIRVTGWEEKTYDFFNPGRNTLDQSASGENYFYFNGYPVDKEGNVSMPVVGKVRVAGYTLTQATDSLQARVDAFLRDSRVVVRLANFSVTVLGEVGSPGRLSLYDDHITVFDALAQSGDINVYGDRQNVTLVRQEGDTSYTYILDLTQANMLSNELLYLRPDDIIYVEPLRARIFTWNTAQAGAIISIVISTITLISLIALR